VLIVAIAMVAGFAAINWPEFIRPAPLSFGWPTLDAPLGLIMLGLLALTLVVFLISSAMLDSSHLIESRRHAKALERQCDLAERAEASRLIDLRQMTRLSDLESRVDARLEHVRVASEVT
jgi:hypothetical protein